MDPRSLLYNILDKRDLTSLEARALMRFLISGEADQVYSAAILTGLHMKGVKAAEILGFIEEIRLHCPKVPTQNKVIVDIVGSGGDHQHTFNISTASALLVAAAGYPVAKHGNRAITSFCGSADVIEALGLPLEVGPEQAARALDEVHFCFFFAPLYHPIMKTLAPVRKALPFRTILNFLGPLLNPALANYALIGISDPRYLEEYTKAIHLLGYKGGSLVHGQDGLDEVSVTQPTVVYPFIEGQTPFVFDPIDYGFQYYSMDSIKGGDASKNAELIEAVLQHQAHPALHQAVILNAGFMLHGLEHCSLQTAFDKAKNLLKLKAGFDTLQRLRSFFATP